MTKESLKPCVCDEEGRTLICSKCHGVVTRPDKVELEEEEIYKYLMAWSDFAEIAETKLRHHSRAIVSHFSAPKDIEIDLLGHRRALSELRCLFGLSDDGESYSEIYDKHKEVNQRLVEALEYCRKTIDRTNYEPGNKTIALEKSAKALAGAKGER